MYVWWCLSLVVVDPALHNRLVQAATSPFVNSLDTFPGLAKSGLSAVVAASLSTATSVAAAGGESNLATRLNQATHRMYSEASTMLGLCRSLTGGAAANQFILALDVRAMVNRWKR